MIPSLSIDSNFDHCNSLLERGITDITRRQGAEHAKAFNYHKYCKTDISNAADTFVKQASISIFGYGDFGAGSSTAQARSKVVSWCNENRSFAEGKSSWYEEARVISEPALLAWNQCQQIAKKDVFISFTPQGDHSRFVHFEIDSTLDADLRLYSVRTIGYQCEVDITDNDGKAISIEEKPLIRNANVQINCLRDPPNIEEKEGIGRITYEEGYISVNTSGPALPVSLGEVVDEYFVTPPKSILAFASNTCPAGWAEYAPAYGRFIRGIDKSGRNVDPSGLRLPGNIQEDNFRSHSHAYQDIFFSETWGGSFQNLWGNKGEHDQDNKGYEVTRETANAGSPETRPKNVSLLYCIKN